MPLNISITKKTERVYSVILEGPIDSDTYLELEKKLKEIITSATKAVILNMAKVGYVSSAGIRAIVWAKKELAKYNATFSMINFQPAIKKVFDTMKILPLFDTFQDIPEVDRYIDQIIKKEMEKEI